MERWFMRGAGGNPCKIPFHVVKTVLQQPTISYLFSQWKKVPKSKFTLQFDVCALRQGMESIYIE
jgi:hypothetical protein